MKLEDATIRDIAEELKRRSKFDSDVKTVVNTRNSSSWVLCAGRNEPIVGKGECMAIVVRGLF